MSESVAILEAQPEGEIAIRRQLAGERDARPAALEIAGERLAAGAPAPRANSPIRAADHARIEDYLRAYLEDQRFRSAHPLARGRWIVAWEMLWCADSHSKVIAVGQRAGDAMHAFSGSMLERCMHFAMDSHRRDPLADGSQRPGPLDGLASITDAYGEQLGAGRSQLLREMFEPWRALSGKLQLHEQGLRPPHERLRWEDGRRLVLFTALVMVEFDRSFA
ncbi:MAG TPA: hypothetical protein VGW98_08145 [Solirubrobacteraceae bacterium]|nr:hypothetical protein [Solirubrobacteraceae bacterium]